LREQGAHRHVVRGHYLVQAADFNLANRHLLNGPVHTKARRRGYEHGNPYDDDRSGCSIH
jgi:hypothetical protein